MCNIDTTIVIVSGLPRSGTSLIMNMLSTAGIDIVTDANRRPDIDNPRGYFEDERVKHLPSDSGWLNKCKGKAVKIVSPLLDNLPLDENYKVIFVHRKLNEVMASQKKMIQRLSPEKQAKNDTGIERAFINHLRKIEKWLFDNNINTLYLWYGDIIQNSLVNAEKIGTFLGKKFDYKRMADIVDDQLYRCRYPEK